MATDVIGSISFKDMHGELFYWNKMNFVKVASNKALRVRPVKETLDTDYEPFETWTFADDFKLDTAMYCSSSLYYYDKSSGLVKLFST